MENFKIWYEARLIAGKKIRTREDNITWGELQGEVNKLIDIIMDPDVDEIEKEAAKHLASQLASQIKRSGHLDRDLPAASRKPVAI